MAPTIEESRADLHRERLHLTVDRARGVGLLPLLRLVDTWPAIVSFTPVPRFSFISSRLLRGRVSGPLSSARGPIGSSFLRPAI